MPRSQQQTGAKGSIQKKLSVYALDPSLVLENSGRNMNSLGGRWLQRAISTQI